MHDTESGTMYAGSFDAPKIVIPRCSGMWRSTYLQIRALCKCNLVVHVSEFPNFADMKCRGSSLLPVCFVLFFASGMYAQEVSSSVRSRVERLLNAADSLSDLSVAEKKVKEALELARHYHLEEEQIRSWVILGKQELARKRYPEAIKNSSRALRLYEKKDYPDFNIVGAHLVMAKSLEMMGAYSDAIDHNRQILDWQLKNPGKTQSQNAPYFTMSNMGRLFMKLEAYDSSLFYFHSALEYVKDQKELRLYAAMYNNLGLVYHERGEEKQAQEAYTKALGYYRKMKDRTEADEYMIALVQGNLAVSLPDDDPKKEEYFQADMEGTQKFGAFDNLASTYIDYAAWKMNLKKYGEAEDALKKAREICVVHNLAHEDPMLEVYDELTRLYIAWNKPEAAMLYYTKRSHLLDQLYGKKARNALMATHTSYRLDKIESELDLERLEGEKKRAEIDLLNKENHLARFQTFTAVSVSVLVIVVLILLILRVRATAKRKAREKELRNRLLRTELAYNSERLSKSVLSLSRKKEFAEELIRRISAMRDVDIAQRNTLKLFVWNELEIDTSILTGEEDVREVGQAFISGLKMRYPELSENDLRLLGYIKMNLTNKQIAELKNITPQAVKMAKNRLRKKLNLPAGSEFHEIIVAD